MFASPFVMHCSILFWTILQATAEGCPGDELIHYPLSLVTREPFREKRVGGDELHVCCQASVHWRCTKQLTRYSRRCPRKSEKFSIGDGAKQEEESIYKYPLGKPVSPQHFSHAKVAHRPSLNASYEWGYRRLLHEYEGVATSGGRAAPLPGRGRHGARNFVNDLYKVLEKLVSKRNCMEILPALRGDLATMRCSQKTTPSTTGRLDTGGKLAPKLKKYDREREKLFTEEGNAERFTNKHTSTCYSAGRGV